MTTKVTFPELPVFSDLQIHNYKQYSNGDDRLYNCLNILDRVWEYADEVGSKYILFPGDLYDSQGNLPTVVVNETINRLKKLTKKFPKVICIAISGNHDHASKNLIHAPAISALKHLETTFPKNFMLIDDELVELPEINTVVFGIPYYEYREHFHKKLQAQSDEAKHPDFKGMKKILMIHQTPTGLGNPNIPVDTDVNDPLYDPFDMVIDGHIHMRQLITDKFLVVGSPIHRTLEDIGQDKGFVSLNTSDPTDWKFISTRGMYPEFKRMRVKSSDELPKESKDYIIPEYEYTKEELVEGDALVEDFGSDLSAATLIENYWREVDGKDEELLKIGLKLIQ